MSTEPETSQRGRQSDLRRALRQQFPLRSRDNLLPTLQLLQETHGYLPEWALSVVGWHLRIPASEVWGAATSYSELRLDPPPAHTVIICDGLACRSAGADALLETVPAVESARDDLEVSRVACAYMCGVAPAARIDGRWHGRLTSERLRSALDDAIHGAAR